MTPLNIPVIIVSILLMLAFWTFCIWAEVRPEQFDKWLNGGSFLSKLWHGFCVALVLILTGYILFGIIGFVASLIKNRK